MGLLLGFFAFFHPFFQGLVKQQREGAGTERKGGSRGLRVLSQAWQCFSPFSPLISPFSHLFLFFPDPFSHLVFYLLFIFSPPFLSFSLFSPPIFSPSFFCPHISHFSSLFSFFPPFSVFIPFLLFSSPF